VLDIQFHKIVDLARIYLDGTSFKSFKLIRLFIVIAITQLCKMIRHVMIRRVFLISTPLNYQKTPLGLGETDTNLPNITVITT